MAKVAVNMENADGYYHSRNQKELDTVAREATQEAEDARRISIVKERERAEQADKDAAARRDEEARNQVAAADAEATQQARLRAQAERERAAAEREKNEALIATAQAHSAQQDAEAARQAALVEQKRLADETAAAQAARLQAESARSDAENARSQAETARLQAEKDAQAMRDRLRDQLNAILETRDTARGLIVSLSDVLFDFNAASLKPGAKEKLAKVSGILLAYPSLRMSVEGHTDSIGTDDYNLKLSQRRADAVRDYLTSNGISSAIVQAIGLGKADPVASNDDNAGRQQNRRVEMVVSGDVIGQPIHTTASLLH